MADGSQGVAETDDSGNDAQGAGALDRDLASASSGSIRYTWAKKLLSSLSHRQWQLGIEIRAKVSDPDGGVTITSWVWERSHETDSDKLP